MRHLVANGYDVALHFNTNTDRATAIAAELAEAFPEAVVVPLQADLLDPAQIEALVPRAAMALAVEGTSSNSRRLQLLVNNASLFEPDTLLSATRTSWDRHMKTNLEAPFFLTQAFARQLLCSLSGKATTAADDAEWPMVTPAAIAGLPRDSAGEPVAEGLVINMIDQRVRKPTPQFATYTLAKQALWAMTQTSAQGLAPAIRVNAIGPGPTLCGARQDPAEYAAQRATCALGRGSNPEDITGALDYFLAARGVTGQLLCVDGGQHLAWETHDTKFRE